MQIITINAIVNAIVKGAIGQYNKHVHHNDIKINLSLIILFKCVKEV